MRQYPIGTPHQDWLGRGCRVRSRRRRESSGGAARPSADGTLGENRSGHGAVDGTSSLAALYGKFFRPARCHGIRGYAHNYQLSVSIAGGSAELPSGGPRTMPAWQGNCTFPCVERYLAGLVAFLLFGALAAFFGFIPIVPVILSVLILTAMVLMFLLGLWAGANAEFLAEADQAQTDSDTRPTDRQDVDATTPENNNPKSPHDSTKIAA
jgi:hypothetical protein